MRPGPGGLPRREPGWGNRRLALASGRGVDYPEFRNLFQGSSWPGFRRGLQGPAGSSGGLIGKADTFTPRFDHRISQMVNLRYPGQEITICNYQPWGRSDKGYIVGRVDGTIEYSHL